MKKFYLLRRWDRFDNNKISEKLNNLFATVVKNLNIRPCEYPSVNTNHIEVPIIKSIEICKNHQSIESNESSSLNNSTFSSDEITISDIEKELKNLDSSKTPQESDIATKMIRDKIDIFVPIMY